MPRKQTEKTPNKVQLKVQMDPAIHRLLRELCGKSRRSPAGQIEFMTIMFQKNGLEERLSDLDRTS